MTFGEIKTLYARYVGANNSAADRINLVIARLLPEGNWKGTTAPVNFVVYPDANGFSTVTLPRELESILAGGYQPTVYGGYPLPVRNGWYEYSPTGLGISGGSDWARGFVPLAGRYTTFADWTTAKKLRLKLEQNETAAKIIFKGTLAGSKIFSTDSTWIEGVTLSFSNATVTTTQKFDAPPYQIIKPITNGRLSLFTVDDDGTETAVGVYEPGETSPSYKRYKVPSLCSASSTTFSTICKKAYRAVVDDNDELLIGNLGAIKHGLRALLKEDADDDARAAELWAEAKALLIAEAENDNGDAVSSIMVEDTFQMASVGGGDGWGGYGYWPWPGYGG